MQNHRKPHKTTRNQVKQCQTIQNLVKLLITTIGNIQKPFKQDFKKTSKKPPEKIKVVSRVASAIEATNENMSGLDILS